MNKLVLPRRTLTLALRCLARARRRRHRGLGRWRARPVLRPYLAAPLKLRYRVAAPSARRQARPATIITAPLAVTVLHRLGHPPPIVLPAVRAAAVPRRPAPPPMGAMQPSTALRQASPARASAADRETPARRPWHGARLASLVTTRSHAGAFARDSGPPPVRHTPSSLAGQRGATAAPKLAMAMSQWPPIAPVAHSDAVASRIAPAARRDFALACPTLELRPVARPTAARTTSRPAPEVELVWRQPPPAASKAPDAPQVLPHTAGFVATPTARTAAANRLPAPSDNPGPVRLDPKTAERLADEVIKRVERQLRIERERRGL